MPIYTYSCVVCGNIKDVLCEVGGNAPYCMECSKPVPRKYVKMKRLFRGGSFQLKGDGWAKDGYADKPLKPK